MSDNKPKRIAHFPDPKLERQIEELIRSGKINAEKVINNENNINEIIDVDTTPPNIPTGLSAVGLFKKFVVSWNPSPEENIDYYVLSYSTSSDNQSTWSDWINLDVGLVIFHNHENLDYEKDYRYRLAAVNTAGKFSQWTDVYIAGKPGKVSLSEDITGELTRQYIKNGEITLDKWSDNLQEDKISWDNAKSNIDNTISKLDDPADGSGPDGQFNSIENTFSDLQSTKGKFNWTGNYFGTIDNVSNSSPYYIEDTSIDWTSKEHELTNLIVRFTNGVAEGLIKTISDYDADKIYLDSSFPSDKIPSSGDNFEIGNVSVLTGTQINQNAEEISLNAESISDNSNFRTSFTVEPSEINSSVSELVKNSKITDLSNITQKHDQIEQTVNRLEFSEKITGTIDSMSSNPNKLTDDSKSFINTYGSEKLKGMAVRVEIEKDGENYGIIRTITDYTETTLTLNENWDSNFTPSVDDNYQIGNIQVLEGTQIDQTNEKVNIMALDVDDNKSFISDFTVAPDEVSSTVREVYPDGPGNASTIQQNSDAINLRVMATNAEGELIPEAQIQVGRVTNEGYIILDADKTIATGTIKADKYAEIRNTMSYNYLDSLDSNSPFICDFHIPSETIAIRKIMLSVKGLPFRAYSTGASGGGHSHPVTIPGHKHSITYNDTGSTNGATANIVTASAKSSYSNISANGHGHSCVDSSPGTDSYTHKHIDSTGGDTSSSFHSHSVDNHDHGIGSSDADLSDAGHAHEVNLSQDQHVHTYTYLDSMADDGDGTFTAEEEPHTHGLIFGIYEDENKVPADVNLVMDNGDGFTTQTTKYNLGAAGVSYPKKYDNTISLGNPDADGIIAEEKDITGFFYGTGWKRIKFTSSQLGRINAQLIIKLDITA